MEIEIFGVYAISNCAGYEFGFDEFGDMYYRLSILDVKPEEWQAYEILTNPWDDDREYAYDEEEEIWLCPMDEIMRV